MSDLIKTLKSSETGDSVYPNIKEDNIPSGAVKTAKINDGAVTTDKLDDESVTTAKLGTLSVTTSKIDTGAVTTAKLDDSAVTTIKLNDGAVTSAKIGNSAVTNAKINDGAVSYDKLASALKNLIDGKASQTDLETLQTAVNGKQDKIDSTHKLDADLVDDSTSTNKFTTASNLSKLSGIESGAEVNTIDTISVNGTPVTPDANRNVNIITGGTIYCYHIDLENDNFKIFFDVYSSVNVNDVNYSNITFETYSTLFSILGNNSIAVNGLYAPESRRHVITEMLLINVNETEYNNLDTYLYLYLTIDDGNGYVTDDSVALDKSSDVNLAIHKRII